MQLEVQLHADGSSGNQPIEEEWIRVAEEVRAMFHGSVDPNTALAEIFEVFKRKQHDYGANNIGAFMVQGVVIRMADKLARLANATLRNQSMANESVDDTLIDLADYAMIALMCHRGVWPSCSIQDLIVGKHE